MFGRRKSDPVGDEATTPVEEAPFDPTAGPFDIAEVGGQDGVERVDLGSLLLAPMPGRELRLQVEEATGRVQSVMIAGPDGGLELRAFAAPRNGDLWSEIRPQIQVDVTGRGGTVTEREGRHGTELLCTVPVTAPDGTSATQQSRIVGVNGPRWLLRATFLGGPARDPENAADWEDVLAGVVVNRGDAAMPVGDLLPLRLPPQARRTS